MEQNIKKIILLKRDVSEVKILSKSNIFRLVYVYSVTLHSVRNILSSESWNISGEEQWQRNPNRQIFIFIKSIFFSLFSLQQTTKVCRD